jgi:mannose-6-phosphate isomerase
MLGAVGESWEISDHGDDVSVVAEGPFRGERLRDLIRSDARTLLGGRPRPFPLLFKTIDAAETLSVQVHPTDEDAAVLEPGSQGKTEAWAILHADPGARIVVGLNPEREPEETLRALARALAPADVEDLLLWAPVERGDVVYLPAGTVHAIGAGIVLVEVQQSSDVTYRIYDWGRPREVHLEKAARVIRPTSGPIGGFPRWTPEAGGGSPRWSLIRGEYFTIDALALEPGGQIPIELADSPESRFGVLIALEGDAEALGAGGDPVPVRAGDFILFPAALDGFVLACRSASSAFSGLWVRPR